MIAYTTLLKTEIIYLWKGIGPQHKKMVNQLYNIPALNSILTCLRTNRKHNNFRRNIPIKHTN